jgi:hypothetical protein
MTADSVTVRILRECQHGHKDMTPRLSRPEAESLQRAGVVKILAGPPAKCGRCGDLCTGGLRLWGWGAVCWSCFQRGGRPDGRQDAAKNNDDGGRNASGWMR